MDTTVLKLFIPEFFLSLCILFQLLYNVRVVNNLKYNFPLIGKEVFYQTLFLLKCVLFLLISFKIEGSVSNFLFFHDETTRIVKISLISLSILILVPVWLGFWLQTLNFFEFFVVFSLSLLALMLLISTTDLLAFYLVIEMQSLCFYILASFMRTSSFSVEAGLKYFISGAYVSCFFLLGCTLIYGSLGTLDISKIAILLVFPLDDYNIYLKYVTLAGIILVTSTLLFKISCAPFHFWSPDVYDGSPLSSTIVFSVVPKIALIYFFVKWVCTLNILNIEVRYFLMYAGIFSTFLGTFYAINQTRVKKLIIYSSIAQIGFIVSALSLDTLGGYFSVFYFLMIYIITSLGVWSYILSFYFFDSKVNFFFDKGPTSFYLSNNINFCKKEGIWAVILLVIFFSMGGTPPSPGFMAKAFVLYELVSSFEIIPSVALIFISCVSVYYYIRIIKLLFFEPNSTNKVHFQVIFYSEEISLVTKIISFCVFLLLTSFLFPTTGILLCEYLVLDVL